MYLLGVYLNSFENSAPSKLFLNRFHHFIISAEHKSKKHVSVATSEKCCLISTASRFFVFWELRLTFFVITVSDSQPLTVVAKNFILDAADVLDLLLSRLQYDRP